jgi:hypothetical protein
MGEFPALCEQDIAAILVQRVTSAATGPLTPTLEQWEWLACWTG